MEMILQHTSDGNAKSQWSFRSTSLQMISGVEPIHSWAAALLNTIRVVTELGQLLGADLSPKLASFMKSECSSLRRIGAHP